MKKTFTRLTQIALVFFLALLSNNVLQATHIVGGDITYKCLGFGDYEVTLTVRRDCDFGEEPFDNTAHIGIFDGYGNLLPWFGTGGMIHLQNPQIDTIDTSLDQGCTFVGEKVCVTQAIYKGVVNIPKRVSGYYFAYQRCCKNSTLTNIVEPLNTGSTYYIRLLEEEMGLDCNSSPSFNEWPAIYICTDQTLNFDHSATDAEGDSLVYKLCSPSHGASFDLPLPVPPEGPPYVDVIYKAPFSYTDPMGGTPLTINSETGMITALPNTIGQWLVGVCVEEYRDGVLLTTVKRDFEYNTRICTAGPMASFDAPNPYCDGFEFTINNTSTDADSYEWSVDPSDNVVFNSTAENPTFTFPSNGIYTITLEAFRDLDNCSTVSIEEVGVYDSNLEASFTGTIESCPGDSTIINLTSTSTDPDYTIESWDWSVSAGDFSATGSGETVSFTVPTVDDVQITLVVTSENGCSETIVETFDADPLDLELLANPMAVCAGDTVQILINPNCDLTYTITPLDFVIFDDPVDPCVISIAPEVMTVYTITVTDGVCTASEDFVANVIDKADLSIIGDTLTCDGIASLEVIGGLVGNQFEWSTSSDFDPIIGTMEATLEFEMTAEVQTFYVRVKEGTGCSNVASFVVEDQSIDISYPSDFVICLGSNEEVIIVNNNENHDLTIVWDENDIIVTTTDSSVIVSTDNVEINTTITFVVTNQYGCSEDGEVNFTAEQNPELGFTADVTCGSLEMCFTNTTTPLDNDFIWDFGDLTTEDDVSNDVSPCYTYPEPGEYEVTLTINEGPCSGLTITHTVVVPVILEISIDQDDLMLCFGEKATLTATTNVDGEVTWTDASGTELGEGTEIEIMGMETTDITVTIVDSFGCEASDVIHLDVYIFDLSDDAPEISCVDEEVTITLTNNSTGDDFTYDWEPNDCIISGEGSTIVVVSATDSKTITVLVTNNENGCDTLYSIPFDISVIDKTISADPANPYQCHEVTVEVTPDNDDCTYIWNNGETESAITDTILQESTYSVTITDGNGCTLVQSITVPVQLPNCDESDVFLPDAFSPNNDGTNDVLFVRSNYVKELDFIVYDRWGELIFQTTDINVGWDGTFGGEELASDVYAVCILATCSNGEKYKMTGNVTLLR